MHEILRSKKGRGRRGESGRGGVGVVVEAFTA